MKFSGLVIASISAFRGDNDKNGKAPIFMNILGGKAPNKALVWSGTIAENVGLELGKTYLIQIRETDGTEEYGRGFNISKVAEMSALEVLQAEKLVGKAEVFAATAVETPQHQVNP